MAAWARGLELGGEPATFRRRSCRTSLRAVPMPAVGASERLRCTALVAEAARRRQSASAVATSHGHATALLGPGPDYAACVAFLKIHGLERRARVLRSAIVCATHGTKPKSAADLAKHGISFTAAARALEDPRKIEVLDDRFEHGEERIQSLCSYRETLPFVVTVMSDENVCRIISARKATRREQEAYFQGGSLFS
jgi:uncharacterized DUF497 family protein